MSMLKRFPLVSLTLILLVALSGCVLPRMRPQYIKFFDVTGRELGGDRAVGIELGASGVGLPLIDGSGRKIQGVAYSDGAPLPDAVILAKDFSLPGETDCFDNPYASDPSVVGITPSAPGKCRITAQCREITAELPVVIFSAFQMSGWKGVKVTADGAVGANATVPRAECVFYNDWDAGIERTVWRAVGRSYIAGSYRTIDDLVTIKTVDTALLSTSPVDNALTSPSILVCEVPGGYIKCLDYDNNLIWEFTSTTTFK